MLDSNIKQVNCVQKNDPYLIEPLELNINI